MTNPSADQLRSPLESTVLRFKDLQLLSGRVQLAAVARWATAQGIRFNYDGRGGIWTTLTALDQALGLRGEEITRLQVSDLFDD